MRTIILASTLALLSGQAVVLAGDTTIQSQGRSGYRHAKQENQTTVAVYAGDVRGGYHVQQTQPEEARRLPRTQGRSGFVVHER
jgi:hypothetical protein